MKAKSMILASLFITVCSYSAVYSNVSAKTKKPLSTSISDKKKTTAPKIQKPLAWLQVAGKEDQHQDLWKYIRSNLTMSVPDNEKVKHERDRYVRQRYGLNKMAVRAEPYMYWIIEEIKKRNLPLELALVPIIESEFNPYAVSSARATGIWQIVPTTGLYYGLKQNDWYDGRRDAIDSTTAALDMLQRLNKMFDGDWLLAVAAYNSGEGRVLNAIKENKAKNKPTDFWSLNLPKETSAYVPRLLALIDIIRNQEKYDVKFPKSKVSNALTQVDVKEQIEMSQLASLSGLSLQQVQSFNAGFKHNVTPPDGPHKVTVPQSHKAQLEKALRQQAKPLVTQKPYLVKSGDKLETVAKRFNSNSDAVKKINKLKSNNLTAGKKIIIPQYSKQVIDSFYQAKKLEKKQLAKYTTKQMNYTVVGGDSLGKVAKKLGVSTTELQTWNKLKKTQYIKIGQTLQYQKKNTTAFKKITYNIRTGDTMTSVAKKYNLDINDVLTWNKTLPNIHRLKMGDELTLYVN